VWKLIENSIRQANGVIVCSKYVRDRLVNPIVNLAPERFLVLPCGVDLENLHPMNTDDIQKRYKLPKMYVICPGALIYSKGPQNVVTASIQYADIAPTIFIGGGGLRDELESLLGSRGRFLGFVPFSDKDKLINAAALLIAAPEKREHFGIMYIEALAGGTPPVAYEGGGVSSIVTPQVGVLTERDPKELGKAVRRLLVDTEIRHRMAVAARARAERFYDVTKLVTNLEKWLWHVLAAWRH
jgi:glycosyltransferase involved in cell wall biosynthesis